MSDMFGAAGSQNADIIKDATIETFEADVLQASMTTPVIVDFWAEWCGPCKQLTPVLEKVVKAAGGSVKLVKIDIDKNQMLASQLRIQSVPTVYGFFQGRPVDGFQGALPESELTAFVNRLASAAGGGAADAAPNFDEALEAAEHALKGGDLSGAAQVFSEIAQVAEAGEPAHTSAILGLVRCHIGLGEMEKARQLFDMAPEEAREEPAAASIRAALELAESQEGAGDVHALSAQVNEAPDDLNARFELAGAFIAIGDLEAALEQLLAITERDREWNEEAARKKILTVFDAMGPTNPATIRGRRRLSSILFS